MNTALPFWVEEAARLPVAFAQVREDPELDAWVVRRAGREVAMMMVASGGCTVAYLVSLPEIARLHVVDPNPAQLALTRVKLDLLRRRQPADRQALLGHRPLAAAERARQLGTLLRRLDLSPEAIGPAELWSSIGPDQAGRYERVFAQLRLELLPHAEAIRALLHLRDPAEQARRAAPNTALGQAIDAAFESAMSLPILMRLFGEGATRNRCEPFARHFARRTRHALATFPAAENPYLAQVLLGEFAGEVASPWLSVPCPTLLPPVTFSATMMTEALAGAAQAFDVVHLSNILDWLSPEEARRTLDLACAALRPGGWVFIRQLNSQLDIPAAGGGFDWHGEEAAALHARDRSYFYRALHLGKKR